MTFKLYRAGAKTGWRADAKQIALASGEEFEEMKRYAGILLTAVLAFSIPLAVAAAELSAKVNIVLEDGTIMMYSGTNAGIAAGDEFEVKRDGKVVGHIKAKDVQQFVTYATLVDGAVLEMDMAYRTKQGNAAREEKPAKASSSKKEEASTSKKERSSSKKSDKKDEDEAKTSSRRDRAKERDGDKKDDEGKKEEKKDEKKAERRPLPPTPAPAAEKKSNWKKPLGSLGASGYGLTGLMFIPTADVVRKGDGSVHFSYIDAEDEVRLLYKDFAFGVTYGIDDDIEVSYSHLNTDYDAIRLGTGTTVNSNTHIFSFKYQTNYFKAPSFLTSNVTESRLALGLRYYDISMNINSSVLGDLCSLAGESCSSDATRVFAVLSGKYSMGTGHLGVYYQTGDLVDDTEYDGFGFLAGAEYIVGGKDNSLINRLSVIGEYDHQAFYLGTSRTPSIGLRYYFAESSHVTLNLLDVTDTAVMNIEGAYGF